jgi:hypothetical protein
MGTRTGPHESNKRIGYDTRQEAPSRGRMLRHAVSKTPAD